MDGGNGDLAKRVIPWVVAVALFMETLDVTIITTAIPQMASGLHVHPVDLKLALTSYLLSLAVFIPISGWIADKYGTKKTFSIALLIFTISSVLCGASNTVVELVIARILQGLGGALMMPVGRLILLKTFPKSELFQATNFATIPSLLGPVLGPLLGGAITTWWSWRYVFFVNIPFGLLGWFLANKYVTNHKSEHLQPFDKIGFALFGFGLSGMSVWIDLIGQDTLNPIIGNSVLAASLVCLAAYFIYSRTTPHPVFDLNVFNVRTFRITVLGSLSSRLGIGGVPFLLPLLFQVGFKLSPLSSGLLTFPLAVAMLIMKFFVNRFIRRFGFRSSLIANTLLLGLSIAQFGLVEHNTPYVLIVSMVFIYGMFASFQFTCMNVLSYADLDAKNLSKGTSIASTVQQLSMGLGVTISAVVLKYFMDMQGPTPLHPSVAFHYSFFVVGSITFLSFLIFASLHNTDGQVVAMGAAPPPANEPTANAKA